MTLTAPPAARRLELAAFLRSRRARITPEQVGLPPGPRRRTPGLRREEVAQLAGVGVTWYTWLEQGRPINASVQVLDAIARTLRLDVAEREHLYNLADVPSVPLPADCGCITDEIQTILDALVPLPAAVYSSRYDLLAWNDAYAAVFPRMVERPPGQRNVLWQLFVALDCCSPFINRDQELPQMVATMRATFGRHLGEPAWTEFVRRLAAESPDFARMWAAHDVASPGTRLKIFRHPAVGEVRMNTSSFAAAAAPESRMIVYTPVDDETRERIHTLLTTDCGDGRCPVHTATPRRADLGRLTVQDRRGGGSLLRP
jgi:transcriptional regulator with XRE-family HTH domain